MYPVDMPHTTYEICLVMAILWFAWIFMSNFYRICVQRRINTVVGIDMATQTDASRTPEMANYECAIGELKYRHQATMWAHFVSRTLAKDRADDSRIPEMIKYERVIGELKNRHQKKMWENKVQVLERWLEKSWTREEVLTEKISQCEASGALVLVHSLSASAFARESDADEVNLES